MAPKRKKPDLLEDQCKSWLQRNTDLPREKIDDFLKFFWTRKMKSDLEIMRSMVKTRRKLSITDA